MNEASLQAAWWFWLCLGLLLLAQGTALFLHSRSRGSRAWFWGLWGIVQVPMPTLTYLLLLWWKKRKLDNLKKLRER